MILDSGVCTVFRKVDMALSGEMPRPSYQPIFQGWFGVLSHETVPARPTDGREVTRTDEKIRIIQCRFLTQNDVVVLAPISCYEDAIKCGAPVYRINRAYHGPDDDGAGLITDMDLEVYRP